MQCKYATNNTELFKILNYKSNFTNSGYLLNNTYYFITGI